MSGELKLAPCPFCGGEASAGGAFGRADEGCGTPLRGQQHRTALTLERLGIGDYSYSDCFECLYFNNQKGLSVRAILEAQNDRHDNAA